MLQAFKVPFAGLCPLLDQPAPRDTIDRMPHDPHRPPTTSTSRPAPSARPSDPLADYHRVADTVGGLPNLRVKDNLYQTIFILIVTAAAAIAGYILGGAAGAILGVLFGLLGSVLLSGIVLMVLGFIRAARK